MALGVQLKGVPQETCLVDDPPFCYWNDDSDTESVLIDTPQGVIPTVSVNSNLISSGSIRSMATSKSNDTHETLGFATNECASETDIEGAQEGIVEGFPCGTIPVSELPGYKRAQPPMHRAKKRRCIKSDPQSPTQRRCMHCGVLKTPQWRAGPSGQKTLCNACGVKCVIFTCTEDSLNDCLRAGVFGLPRTHFQYVQHVRPSMVLFLFNFSTRELHGIFRAITGGKLDGDPSGVNPDWAAKFPAQVHVDTSDTYPPLPESTFRRYIQENYLSSNGAQFSFELDMEQVALLSEAFKHFAVSRTTPAAVHAGSFPAPSPTNVLDRPSQAWLADKTRRLSPVGHRTGLEFLNYGRPKSSLDYLGTHAQHFETDLGFLGGGHLQQPRMSMDIPSLNSLLSATATSQLLGNDPLVAQSVDSRFFPNEPPVWNGETLNLSNLGAPLNTAFPSPLGLASDNAASARLSMGRLSPGHVSGHLSPDLVDGWNADAATANAFKMAAARLTPDLGMTQQTGPSIASDDRKRSSIWSVNSRDMGLVDQQKLLSGVTFPEVQQEGLGLNGHAAAELNALHDASRGGMYGEGSDVLWSGTGVSSWKPPRPHSSTDGEVQNLTKNLQSMWSDAKQQVHRWDTQDCQMCSLYLIGYVGCGLSCARYG